MDIPHASEYWGIPNHIARRNRKSGAKKRKQRNIEAEHLAVQETSAVGRP